MADTVKIRWDQSRFDRTFARYMEHTSRDLVTAINTKSYFIARKATWFTHKADRGKIESSLGRRITTMKTVIKGGKARLVSRRGLELTRAKQYNAPLAGLIINKRRGKKASGGKGGLTGRDMARAIRDLLAARLRSVAYFRSGWLAAIKRLAPLADKAGAPPMDTSARTYGGVAKGSVYPAVNLSTKSASTIINEAWSRHDQSNAAFYKHASRGLQRAFDDETKSMARYIKDKMLAAENQFNAAQR